MKQIPRICGFTLAFLLVIFVGLAKSQTHTLNVSKAGNGSGTVTSKPTGINCGTTCSKFFLDTAAVTLTAKPAKGSIFAGWSGDCSGTGSCKLSMNVAHAVTATFNLPRKFQVAVTKGGTGGGTVTSKPTGINCGGVCSAMLTEGTLASLTAKAAKGSVFAGWSGACSGTGKCSRTMNGDISITAMFNNPNVPPTFALTVAKQGTGNGTVTSIPAGISCGTDCTETYNNGTNVTLAAIPDGQSSFAGWSGDADCSDGAVTMNGAKNCTATFTSLVIETASQLIIATQGGTITLPGGSSGRFEPASLSEDTQVTIELLSKSPIEPFNEDFTTLDKGLRVVIERGDLVGPITFGIAVGSLSDHENAIGSLVFGSEFIPAPITPNQQTQIIEIRHNFSQSLSVPQPILAPRDIKKTAVGSSVLGILKEFLVFSVTGDLQINEQLVAQFDGQNWGEVDPSLLTGLEGKTVIIAVHGIRSNLQDTFPSSCARKLANTKPGNTVLLGFQYDFNTSISTNMDAFASFLRQLRSNNPTIKVHIVAHSMGTLVSSGAIFNGNLDSTMFASFFPISGMATGTPSADAAPGFVTDLLNTKMGKTISPVGQVAGTITIGHLFDALPEGIGQMGREPLDFVPLFLRGRSSTDIPVVVAYGNPDDRVVPSDSWSSWAEYFPNATTKVKGSGHSIVCGRDGNADEVINDIVTIISTPPPPPPTLPTITITATDLTATEAGPTPGTFTVSRTGSTSSPLTILYSVSGSATAGSDYNELSSSVIIPAGFSTATITVVPIDETIVESDETVVVTLTLNAAYTVGSLSSAIVTITDNDFLLTVSTGAGTGSGGVTSTDGKINCPGDCTEGYNSGTVVTLTATPNAGSTFAGWSGVCAGTGSCVVTMDGNKTVTATFNLSAGGGGTVTPGNVTLGTAGSCTGGALTTTFQVSAASNVTWTASGDPQTPPLGGGTLKVAPGSGSGSGSLVVTITVPPQLPSSSFSNCSLTYNLGTFSNVFVTFSDGSVIGVTVYWTFVGVT